ncbi:F0F1 ATP synthase subunit gamma, partial [uncultured Muribaculum sp.]
MATLRELKGRIGSVKSSEKITGAMKMISSAKMHKAEQALKRLLPFRGQIQTIIGNLLSADAEFSSPLIENREVKRIGIVVFGSDDGLCGAYNMNVFKGLLQKLHSMREKHGQDVDFVIYPVGGKMYKAARRLSGAHIEVRQLVEVNSKSSGKEIRNFTFSLQQEYLDGNIDLLEII